MTQWLDQILKSIEKIQLGSGADPAVKAEVEALKGKLAANDANDADQAAAISALVEKLAASQPTEAPTAAPTEAPTEAPVE